MITLLSLVLANPDVHLALWDEPAIAPSFTLTCAAHALELLIMLGVSIHVLNDQHEAYEVKWTRMLNAFKPKPAPSGPLPSEDVESRSEPPDSSVSVEYRALFHTPNVIYAVSEALVGHLFLSVTGLSLSTLFNTFPRIPGDPKKQVERVASSNDLLAILLRLAEADADYFPSLVKDPRMRFLLGNLSIPALELFTSATAEVYPSGDLPKPILFLKKACVNKDSSVAELQEAGATAYPFLGHRDLSAIADLHERSSLASVTLPEFLAAASTSPQSFGLSQFDWSCFKAIIKSWENTALWIPTKDAKKSRAVHVQHCGSFASAEVRLSTGKPGGSIIHAGAIALRLTVTIVLVLLTTAASAPPRIRTGLAYWAPPELQGAEFPLLPQPKLQDVVLQP